MFTVEREETGIPGLLIINFGRFRDNRGFFTESARISDLSFIPGLKIVQANESLSAKNTVRGLHFQWDPPMGKLVRCIKGSVYDLLVDIRRGSPTFGKGIILRLTRDEECDTDSWVWAPPGVAHGFASETESVVEYLCTGEYNHEREGNISPFAKDIDWSLADRSLLEKFREISENPVISDKDKNGPSLSSWADDPRSNSFLFKPL